MRAVRIQWILTGVFLVAAIPAVAMIIDAGKVAAAMAQERLTWELLACVGSGVVVCLLQTRVTWNGAFGVCAFPPMRPFGKPDLRRMLIALHGLGLVAMVVAGIAIPRLIELHLGTVLNAGFLLIWMAAFNVLWLIAGPEGVVPRRLWFLLRPRSQWMLRSCVDAVRDKQLPLGDRLFALELIALRPWVPGALEAVQGLASAHKTTTELSLRAQEVYAKEFAGSKAAA